MAQDPKDTLIEYLQTAREAVLWKLDGLSEHDARRPLTPTGTNVLGLVKHLASVELGYFGDTFDRPHGEDLPWHADGAGHNDDLFATPDQTREDVVGLYHRAWAHAAATFAELDLDAQGAVPWWPAGRREVSLHQILVHVLAETARHGGHADIVRELIDGAAGVSETSSNLPDDDYDWAAHHAEVERAAQTFAAAATEPGRGGTSTPMKVELIPLPVADVDRAIAFYTDKLGFTKDLDVQPGEGVRVVQLTPEGSGCSVGFGTGLEVYAGEPGSIRGLHLVVEDITQARAELVRRGVAVGEIHDFGGGVRGANFSDPDGNSFELQEMAWRTGSTY